MDVKARIEFLAAEVQRLNDLYYSGGEAVVPDVDYDALKDELTELVAEHHLHSRVAAFELDLDRVIELAPHAPSTSELSGYPAATQDLTLVVAAEVPAADVLDVVVAGAGALLEEARIVDDYRGQGLEDGTKALTFALRFRATDRTLKAEEASEAKLAGVAEAERVFGAKLRD